MEDEWNAKWRRKMQRSVCDGTEVGRPDREENEHYDTVLGTALSAYMPERPYVRVGDDA